MKTENRSVYKRLIAIGLAAALMAGFAAGCSGNGQGTAATTKTDSSVSPKKQDESKTDVSSGEDESKTDVSPAEKSKSSLSETPESSFKFTETGEGTMTVANFSGSETEIVIPSSAQGKPVTSIGGGAFYDYEAITSVIIPDGVTSIGDSAFSGCTSLASITIPASVTSIEAGAFFGCTALTIHAPSGSEAQRYAQAEGISFEAL